MTKITRGKTLTRGNFKPKSIIDFKSYQNYKSKSKLNNRKDVEHYVEHGKLLRRFYEIIGEKMIDSTGGVFIHGLGYFGNLMTPGKYTAMANKGEEKRTLNAHSNGIQYNMQFVPLTKDNALMEWCSDTAFSKKVRSRAAKAIRGGKKYSFNPQLFFEGKLRKPHEK